MKALFEVTHTAFGRISVLKFTNEHGQVVEKYSGPKAVHLSHLATVKVERTDYWTPGASILRGLR